MLPQRRRLKMMQQQTKQQTMKAMQEKALQGMKKVKMLQ